MRRRPNSVERGAVTIAGVIVAGLLATAQAGGQSGQQPAANVAAEGNFFSEQAMPGSLRFNPAAVAVKVGDTVRWTNTDNLVPHTATEDHGLWNLTGTYGQTPANPPGFGPGESRQRRFAAGSWSYYCEVHPVQMHGTVSVPDELSSRPALRKKHRRKKHRAASVARAKKKKKPRRFEIVAVWATEALPKGQVFDVQARSGGGDWSTVAEGTDDLRGVFPAGRRGTIWSFRSRVRAADEPKRASGYSPEATITVG